MFNVMGFEGIVCKLPDHISLRSGVFRRRQKCNAHHFEEIFLGHGQSFKLLFLLGDL